MFLIAEFGRENVTLLTPTPSIVDSGGAANKGRGGIFPRFCIRSEHRSAIVRFDIMEIECTDATLKHMIQIVFKRATGTTRPLIRHAEKVI